MSLFDEPVFVLTSDVDWASEYCVGDFLDCVIPFGIRPTVFMTHRSPLLEECLAQELIEVGLHPNFLPGSDHGRDVKSVIEHMFRLVPNAVSFRSHAYVDSTEISLALVEKGIKYDSNLCLYLQPNLKPLWHWLGTLRFPVFWEDDVHSFNGKGWDFSEFKETFFSPGLKILNVHPFMFAVNVPTYDYYQKRKEQGKHLTEKRAKSLRFKGPGERTFLLELLAAVRDRGYAFQALGDLYRQCRAEGLPAWRDDLDH